MAKRADPGPHLQQAISIHRGDPRSPRTVDTGIFREVIDNLFASVNVIVDEWQAFVVPITSENGHPGE